MDISGYRPSRRGSSLLGSNQRIWVMFIVACVILLGVVLIIQQYGPSNFLEPVVNKDTTTLVSWSPSKFHPGREKWKNCIGTTFTDHPSAQYYSTRPVFIVAWDSLENFLYIHEDSMRNCPVPCFIAGSLRKGREHLCSDEVDGYIFHPPTREQLQHGFEWPNKRYYQSNVLFSTETESNWPILKDENYLSQMDLNMTYRLKSDVPFTYFIDYDFYTLFWPWSNTQREIQRKKVDAPVMMMISNCAPDLFRTQYLKELMKYVRIDSYGSCMNNKEIPSELLGPDVQWWETKWNLTAKYKMVIAFENSVHEDYVTEKLFHALIVGTVPVYFGAPNVDRFLPSRKSIINVEHFKDNPKELGEMLNRLNQDDHELAGYLKWKDEGPRREFFDLQKTSPRTGPCRLCMKIAERQSQLKKL
eukprot:TRINITY_DN27103_c0_g1_i1.p1 TRINITY_DN27103_c0_g1~~TRINITY_DN27103_c0_g1_i1.p1  ORF type:complete len:416 (-),score=29.24 TRINITY_DN27103_c0_g1_i1:91-1338(-)